MSWNYRIVYDPSVLPSYSIREVYYNDDGSLQATTVLAPQMLGESVEELKNDYELMARAFTMPVVKIVGNELQEVTDDPSG